MDRDGPSIRARCQSGFEALREGVLFWLSLQLGWLLIHLCQAPIFEALREVSFWQALNFRDHAQSKYLWLNQPSSANSMLGPSLSSLVMEVTEIKSEIRCDLRCCLEAATSSEATKWQLEAICTCIQRSPVRLALGCVILPPGPHWRYEIS